MRPLLFRLRVELKATGPVQLHPHQAGLVYALVAEANGRAHDTDPALPEGFFVEPVEQCRVRIPPHSPYAFGLSLISHSTDEARLGCQAIRRGLRLVGQQPAKRGAALGGNFSLTEIHDLVAKRDLPEADAPAAIPVEDVCAEIDRLRGLTKLTVRFHSPLRMAGSRKGKQGERRDLFDRRLFDAAIFLRRVRARLQQLGILAGTGSPAAAGSVRTDGAASPGPHVLENHLVWLEVAYGSPMKHSNLGGAVGEVTLGGLGADDIETLAWGQYVHAGENTRFGHGRYRIAQLGDDPYECPRTTSLRDLAFAPALLDGAAERYEVEPGRLGRLVQQIRAGTYLPQRTVRLEIASGSKTRILSIPRREDRALQRAVLDLLAPAIDALLEPESLAYRKGRGRFQAPPRIRHAVADGFRWAVRADFSDFYNSIDHVEMEHRLRAYVNDHLLVSLMMTWVREGAPEPTRGLPTGAVISPLLANILLDEFDENVRRSGGRLIRYADDFVILFRRQEDAERMFAEAEAEAERLRLQLNEEKSGIVDLHEPFRFLGFRFFLNESWQKEAEDGPRSIDQLGWTEVAKVDGRMAPPAALAGETAEQVVAAGVVAVVGPGIEWLDLRDDVLRIGHRDGERKIDEVALDRVDQVVALDFPRIGGTLLRRLAYDGKPLVIASGTRELWVSSEELEHPGLVESQVICRSDAAWRMELARSFIIAKLGNYAALADALRDRPGSGDLARRLREGAHRAGRCETMPELLGVEGSGAAAWYDAFEKWVPGRLRFPGRRAPHAEDPVNVLLNIGFTALHRWLSMLLKSHGFAPSLGFLHESRPGHAALASDMQEPFRHLVDRTVLEFAAGLLPSDYRESDTGPYRLHVHHAVQKRFRGALHRQWNRCCQGMFQASARPYLSQMTSQVRALRLHLLDRCETFVPFVHPDPPVPT